MFESKLKNLNDLLLLKLKVLYDVENELVEALPKMAESASEPELKKGFEEHLKETQEHVSRLETAFKILGQEPDREKSKAIRGIVSDAEWCINEDPGEEVLDSLLISAASYAEHYEMSGYMTASRWARFLGQDEIVDLLEQTLAEEENSADKLAMLAEDKVDEMARDVEVE